MFLPFKSCISAPCALGLLSLLFHIFCLRDQIVDLLAAKYLPQETEIFQFGAKGLIFSFEPVVGGGQMLVLPVEPTVGVIQPMIAVQRLVVVVEHLSDNLFQFLNEWVNKPLLIGLGGHQGGWIGELKLCIRLNSLLQPLNGMCPLIEVLDSIPHRFQLVLLFGQGAVQRRNFFFSFLFL